jgi:hypothetical protein
LAVPFNTMKTANENDAAVRSVAEEETNEGDMEIGH